MYCGLMTVLGRNMFKNTLNFTMRCVRSYTAKAFSIQEKNISELILNNTGASLQNWEALREKLLTLSSEITTNTIDSLIISSYIGNEHLTQAKSYINYLQNKNIKLNLATVGKCFKLHYFMHLKGLTTEKDEENILQMYENLINEYPLLDSITSENVILGLSVTKKWKACFHILKDTKITCIPNAASYNALISAAFSHDDYDTAWLLFQEMIENNRTPTILTYLAYLERIKEGDCKTKHSRLNDLFENVASYGLDLHTKVAEKIIEITDGNSKLTSISKEGTCKCCNSKLRRLGLSASEFEELKDAFFKNVIIGKNVFYKTTPVELERFKGFVESMDKFDVIVDGLNVAYSAGVKQSPLVHSMLLAAVVEHFVKQRKKVLILGRRHLEKLPKKNWFFVKRNSTVFLVDDISQDDPYILYCGLHCGPNTIIVSRDFMRSHLYLLKDKYHKLLFNRWLTQTRYHLLHANEEKVFFKMPLPYMRTPQRDKNYWHVPYIAEINSEKEPIYKWLCINW